MLSQRSQEKELLDLGPEYYSAQEYVHCQRILFKINKLLGIFKDTVKFLKIFPSPISLLDIGCGSGRFLLHLSQYFPHITFIGTDISGEAINLAQNELQTWQKAVNADVKVSFWLQTQPTLSLADNSVDVILTTMVCHHLDNAQLIPFLQQTLSAARKAVVIHDLHRHFLAQWLFRIISRFFRNRLIRHDGLISIRKGFTRSDWQHLLKSAKIDQYQIKWRFPFRWSIVLWK